jgi:hypothetical protein
VKLRRIKQRTSTCPGPGVLEALPRFVALIKIATRDETKIGDEVIRVPIP